MSRRNTARDVNNLVNIFSRKLARHGLLVTGILFNPDSDKLGFFGLQMDHSIEVYRKLVNEWDKSHVAPVAVDEPSIANPALVDTVVPTGDGKTGV